MDDTRYLVKGTRHFRVKPPEMQRRTAQYHPVNDFGL
jgi:hypothetical protein